MIPPADGCMQRVAVVGSSCAGKSTLAERLSKLTGRPHVQLDALHWQPGWVERDAAEFRQDVDEATSQPQWIVDGNYTKVSDLVWRRAQTVIWLDYSFATVFSRALRRTARRCLLREPLYNGNRETLRKALLSRDSILLWVITTFHSRRRQFLTELYPPGATWQVLRMRTPAETQQLVDVVASSHG